jgi:anaerobic magnesium-protoporphyrin IX monomethyl ester cyclase
MKVLLCSPESAVWNSRSHIHMGLAYLAGSLRTGGHQVEIYDAGIETVPLNDVITNGHFDVVGISAPTPLIYEAWAVAAAAKQLGAVTILGGPHLALMPQESMAKPQVDLVVVGEAEDTILEIMAALSVDAGHAVDAGGPRLFTAALWKDIRGLWWRGDDGKVVANMPRPLRQDIDSIPFPAFDLFKVEQYTNLQPITDGLMKHPRSYTIVTSRGCPYQCTYCSKPITGNTWRPRSVESVIKEWKWLVEDLHANEIGVTDDIWNLDIKRSKELCRALIREGLNKVPWVTIHGMKVNHCDLELFQLMKQAGCKRVGFGVESGDDRILKHVIKKSQTKDMVRQAFKWCKQVRMQTMGFFILGMPTETEETMENTIKFAIELDPDLANFMIAAPFPGTKLWDIVTTEGNIFSHDWSEFAIQESKAHYEIGDLTAELVERKWHEAYRRFYMRPARVWKRATSLDTWRRLPFYVQNFLRFFVGTQKPRRLRAPQ